MAEEIADLQAAERELVREKLLGNFEQWLGRQVHHFNRLDAEFGRRELKYSPTESVFRMMMASRKLLDRYFFEDDRPRQRRASEQRVPSSPAPEATQSKVCASDGRAAAPSAAAIDIIPSDPKPDAMVQPSEAVTIEAANLPLPRAAKTEFLAALATSPGQDEGASRSVAAPQPSADNALETGAYSENPAKTQPFPSQNSGIHNPALSCTPPTPVDAPIQPEIQNPKAKIADPSEAEIDFGGESIPISPYESTREWLARQGIQVSKIPEGARIITAA